jgi:hypothetical protein
MLIVPTCHAHAVAPFQRVPDHGPVRNGQQRLGYFLWCGCECAERRTGAAQDERLEARRRQRSVGHLGWHSFANRCMLLEKTLWQRRSCASSRSVKSHPAELERDNLVSLSQSRFPARASSAGTCHAAQASPASATRLSARPDDNNNNNAAGRHEQRPPCPSTTTAMTAASPRPGRAPPLGTALAIAPCIVVGLTC